MNLRSLKQAARQAKARGGFDAAILFGSRARGTAGPHSDWDICIIGGKNEDRARQALNEERGPDNTDTVDILWTASTDPLAGAREATVWADIVRDGQVLTGDPAMLKNIEIRPFKIDTLARELDYAEASTYEGIERTELMAEMRASVESEGWAIRASQSSTDAAEALGRLFCLLADTKHSGTHNMARNADAVSARAEATADSADRATLVRMAECMRAMNGTTRKTHGAAYCGQLEANEAWVGRLKWAIRSQNELVQGVLHGTGPMKALGTHERADEIRVPVRTLAQRINRWLNERLSQQKFHPDDEIEQELGAWHGTCAEAERTQPRRRDHRHSERG